MATRTRRGLLGALSGAAGAWAVAACGAPGDAGQAAQTKVQGSIEFWQWGVSYTEGFQKLAGEFNEKMNGARVNHSQPEGYDDKIKVTIAAGSGAPDVYLMRGTLFKQWALEGLAIDLTPFVNKDKAAANDLKATHKTFYDYYHHNGKLHGAPWDFSTISIAYNTDLLEARGLRPPAELGTAWDWTAFADYAKRLTPGDGSKYGVDANNGIETGFYNWVVANGGEYWSEDYKKCTVNTPQFIAACEAYMSNAYRNAVAAPRPWITEKMTGLSHRANLLTNGHVAMQTAGDWFFVWYERAAPNGFKWDVAPMPYSPNKKTGSIANFRGLSVSPTAQNRDLAWAWIANLLKKDVQDRVPSLMGEVPARVDSIDGVYLSPSKSPTPKSRKLLKASVDATKPLPANPFLAYADINSTSNVLANDAYDGKRTVKDAVEEMQTKLTALLAASPAAR